MSAIAVLHGFDPETGKTTSDMFTNEDAHYSGPDSPYHRAARLRDSVGGDFPTWIWSIGQNDESREAMKDQNLRAMGLNI